MARRATQSRSYSSASLDRRPSSKGQAATKTDTGDGPLESVIYGKVLGLQEMRLKANVDLGAQFDYFMRELRPVITQGSSKSPPVMRSVCATLIMKMYRAKVADPLNSDYPSLLTLSTILYELRTTDASLRFEMIAATLNSFFATTTRPLQGQKVGADSGHSRSLEASLTLLSDLGVEMRR